MWPFGSDPTLEVVPAGDVDPEATATVERSLAGRFAFETDVEDEVPLDPRAYDPEREQYDAADVLDHVAALSGADLTVLVLAEDLAFEDRRYVFGTVAPDAGVVAMSTYRLREDDPSPERYRGRVRKEAFKLVGRALTGETCAGDGSDDCVMEFAPTVRELDLAPETFCEACREQLSADLA